ncbi:helix-turn-helix domain-containing protein [Maridesulfovibrio ferrireducens]|uniref:helix-turn-helix domain-containing protein n=1 Tax=Maridesulfovibrio ferrireducens TaxID=246191 RepID=UPI001A2F180A|nr:helix-turn-helix transcriptional regulator [Maridesulfovibrio ferrireducens]MBI9110304.1 helix-turn-helix transcriptional regulator [Maridesulfovibrio ferrireducens]
MSSNKLKPELEEHTQRIKAFVKELELQHKDLGNSANISRPTVSAYLKQENQPSMVTLSKWVKTFGLNGHWLLTGEGEMLVSGTTGDIDEEDPIIRRMREAKSILKDAPPEVLYEVIKNITSGNSSIDQEQKKKAS